MSRKPTSQPALHERIECDSLTGEKLIRLNQVPRLLPRRNDGRRVGISTVYRWCQRGVRGIRLEYFNAPWGRVTSVEAVRKFIEHLNDRSENVPSISRLRHKQIHRAEAQIARRLRVKGRGSQAVGVTHIANSLYETQQEGES